jgi:NAD(P)-dependent dehydrogenase (short-subunit alcohol dehydrogenase family)
MLYVLILCLTLFTGCTDASAHGKVVLITGASRGLGLATAECLADNGYRVYAGVRDLAECSDQKNLAFVKLDVTDLATIQSAVGQIIAKEGRLDVLINNAAYAVAGPLESLTMEEMQRQMDVNFFGSIRVCQEVLPQMRRQKSGHIINISSEQGVYGCSYGSLYSASKAALESVSEALSIELMPWDIHVSIVEPGLITTKFTIQMGSRVVDGNPYHKIVGDIKKSLNERSVHPELLIPNQSAPEVAEFLLGVLEDPAPKLRYQTSEACKEMVSMKLSDLSGEKYLAKMLEFESK